MHDRPMIRAHRAAGFSVSAVARRVGSSRAAVRRATAPGARDRYWRPSPSHTAEPAVRDVLADYPHMTVADIGVLIGWRHSRQSLGVLVARLRPEYIARDDRPARRLSAQRITARRLSVRVLAVTRASVGRVA